MGYMREVHPEPSLPGGFPEPHGSPPSFERLILARFGWKWGCPTIARRVSNGAQRARRERCQLVLFYALFTSRMPNPRCIPSQTQGGHLPQRCAP